MKCKTCGKEVLCSEHGETGLDEFQHDMDESWYYSCGKCINEGAGAFGSIIHWCNDMFGMFSKEGKEIEIDGCIISTKYCSKENKEVKE